MCRNRLLTAAVLLLCLLAVPARASGADAGNETASDRDAGGFLCTFGGETYFRADFETSGDGLAGGSSIFRPAVECAAGPFRAAFVPRLALSSDGIPEMTAASLYAFCSFPDGCSFRLGRFVPESGNALLFGVLDWFSGPVSPGDVFDGPARTRIGADLIELSAARGAWNCSVSCAPFGPACRTVAPTDPLFARKDIRETYVTGGLLSNTYNLNGISWSTGDTDGDRADFPVWDPSFAFVAGITGGGGGLSIRCFSGPDAAPAVSYRFTLTPFTAANTYDLELRYRSRHVRSAGLSSFFMRDSFRIWLDAAFVDGRCFAVGDFYDDPGEWQAVTACRTLSWTTGFSVDVTGKGSLVCGAEWRNSAVFDAPDAAVYPFLYRALYGFAEAALAGGKITGKLECVYSLADGSYVLLPSVRVRTGDRAFAELRYAAPAGAADTELGQYGQEGKVFLSMTASY